MNFKEKVLVLFTAEYPYGIVAETFLETEIQYLCNAFDRVIIVPSLKQQSLRKLPSNAYLENIVCENSQELRLNDYLAIFFFFLKTVLGENKSSKYFRYFRDIFFVLRQERKKYKALKVLVKAVPSNALFYDYWYINSTLALTWLKGKGLIQTLVCRAHAYDLYDERSFAGVILFRKHIAEYLDRVFFISSYGMDYFKQRVPEKLHSKLHLSYLGVKSAKVIAEKDVNTGITIVSIARLMPYKRVEKIAEVLNYFQTPVTWVHFGGGDQIRNLEAVCKNISNPLVKWRLMGQVDNCEVEDFIINNKISASITLSTSEGLPVSIMELIRYGIPVLATNLPGMEQIINADTGVLVEIDDSPQLIARKLEEICNWGEDKRRSAIRFFEANYNADNNYTSFASQLLKMNEVARKRK